MIVYLVNIFVIINIFFSFWVFFNIEKFIVIYFNGLDVVKCFMLVCIFGGDIFKIMIILFIIVFYFCKYFGLVIFYLNGVKCFFNILVF